MLFPSKLLRVVYYLKNNKTIAIASSYLSLFIIRPVFFFLQGFWERHSILPYLFRDPPKQKVQVRSETPRHFTKIAGRLKPPTQLTQSQPFLLSFTSWGFQIRFLKLLQTSISGYVTAKGRLYLLLIGQYLHACWQ